MPNQNFFFIFVADIKNKRFKGTVLRIIMDETDLLMAELKSGDPNRQMEAAEKILDKPFLKETALAGKSIHTGVICKITDYAILKEIALNDKDEWVREKAVFQITDQAVLKEVALSDDSCAVRKAAAYGITDEELLKEIASTDESWEVRDAAIRNITDQAFLQKVVLTDEYWFVRLITVERLTNVAFLKDLASNNEDEDIRKAAAKRLKQLRKGIQLSLFETDEEELKELRIEI
jgi:hypothetical protein